MDEIISKHRVAFVTGGSGFVGGRLIQVLRQQGWEVRALARSSGAASAVERLGAIAVPGELTDRAALTSGMNGSDIVFHVAAMFKLWGGRTDFDAVNVGGMRAVVHCAVSAKSVRKVVAVSAAAVVMGDPEPMVAIDERHPVQSRSFAPYGASKAEAENLLLEANGRRPGFETVAVRPPMIWGAGMPMLERMVEAVKAGQWQWVDHGTQAMSTIHVDNLIDAILLAAENGQGGQAYFVADAEEGTLKSVISGLLATRGVKPADKSVSFRLAWMIAGITGVVWRGFRLKGEPPITRQMLRLVGKPFTLRIDKAKRDLGYAPRVTWQDGIREMTANGMDRPLIAQRSLQSPPHQPEGAAR